MFKILLLKINWYNCTNNFKQNLLNAKIFDVSITFG